MTYYCRECACFVRGPLAPCTGCGHQHSHDHRALEQPIPFTRAGQRRQRARGANRYMAGHLALGEWPASSKAA